MPQDTIELLFKPEAFKAAADYAQTLMAWSLLILGGSIITLLQTSYHRPQSLRIRISYLLLFFLGWSFLIRSIYFGTRTYQVYLSFLFSRNPSMEALRKAVSQDLISQTSHLTAGLVIFGIWVTLHLGWWTFHKESEKREPRGFEALEEEEADAEAHPTAKEDAENPSPREDLESMMNKEPEK